MYVLGLGWDSHWGQAHIRIPKPHVFRCIEVFCALNFLRNCLLANEGTPVLVGLETSIFLKIVIWKQKSFYGLCFFLKRIPLIMFYANSYGKPIWTTYASHAYIIAADVKALGVASLKHTMRNANTNAVTSAGRLNRSPFQPSTKQTLQVHELFSFRVLF